MPNWRYLILTNHLNPFKYFSQQKLKIEIVGPLVVDWDLASQLPNSLAPGCTKSQGS